MSLDAAAKQFDRLLRSPFDQCGGPAPVDRGLPHFLVRRRLGDRFAPLVLGQFPPALFVPARPGKGPHPRVASPLMLRIDFKSFRSRFGRVAEPIQTQIQFRKAIVGVRRPGTGGNDERVFGLGFVHHVPNQVLPGQFEAGLHRVRGDCESPLKSRRGLVELPQFDVHVSNTNMKEKPFPVIDIRDRTRSSFEPNGLLEGFERA